MTRRRPRSFASIPTSGHTLRSSRGAFKRRGRHRVPAVRGGSMGIEACENTVHIIASENIETGHYYSVLPHDDIPALHLYKKQSCTKWPVPLTMGNIEMTSSGVLNSYDSTTQSFNMNIPYTAKCTLNLTDITPAPSYCVPGTPFTFSASSTNMVRIPVLEAREVVVIAIQIIGETTDASPWATRDCESKCKVVAVIREREGEFIRQRFPLIQHETNVTNHLLVNLYTDKNNLNIPTQPACGVPNWVKTLVNTLNTDTWFGVLLQSKACNNSPPHLAYKGKYDFKIRFQNETCIEIPPDDPKNSLFVN